ncbi:HBL204Wp [Eremothecium sinecaudum]|uniref:HBL204Wp n=1 Tax=Eremothecium sinecaudum TaxID=45286 RepID=A0A109UWC3_9SACH|nr:HBL204Wp [Eremothecium sinecaudum]AMD18698.1 HBL204Wp [Eremothecium sinecaudum]
MQAEELPQSVNSDESDESVHLNNDVLELQYRDGSEPDLCEGPLIQPVTLIPSESATEIKEFEGAQLHIPKVRQSDSSVVAKEVTHQAAVKGGSANPVICNLPNTLNLDPAVQRTSSEYNGGSCFVVNTNIQVRTKSSPSAASHKARQQYYFRSDIHSPPLLQDWVQGEEHLSGLAAEDINYLEAYLIPYGTEVATWRAVKQIGAGNFSDVYLYEAVDKRVPVHLRNVAVKNIRYPAEILSKSTRHNPKSRDAMSRLESSLVLELSVLRDLNHHCIVKLLGINDLEFLSSEQPLTGRSDMDTLPPCKMVVSFCAGGDLLGMAKLRSFPDWLIQRIFAELAHAILYLHSNMVIHRDLKLENVLLKYPLEDLLKMQESTEDSIIELTDFGLCKKIQQDELCTTRCGSEDYVSPEILMGLPYDGKLCDTWALGVILYALLEDRLPFDPLPAESQRRSRIRSTAHRIARLDWLWVAFANVDHNAKVIVENCLVSRKTRWDIGAITSSDYVSSVASELVFLKEY